MGRPPLVSRDEMIAAARDVFRREGLSASIRDVAAVAGISEAAIFKRFPTKAALIIAAMAPPRPDIPELLAPLESDDLRAGIAATMENITAFFRDMLPITLPVAMQPDVGIQTYVEEVGAGGHERQAVRDRDVGIEVLACLAERVRRDVDHAHDRGTTEVGQPPHDQPVVPGA